MFNFIFTENQGGNDANQDDLDLFEPVGEAVQPVILKLAYGFPRIRCVPSSTMEESENGTR